MQQIVNFLIRYRNLLLYLVLLVVAIGFTINTRDYHGNAFISSSQTFAGGVLGGRSALTDYLDLDEENRRLQEENAQLRMRLLAVSDTLVGSEQTLSLNDNIPYTVFPARVVKNRYSLRDNYLTIDIGTDQGIEPDMGVLTYKGIVGIVDQPDARFTRVASILNTQLSISAQIKGTSVIGSLNWEGDDPYTITLKDVPRLAQVAVGDTIVTGSQSSTFPPDISIGTVKNVQLVDNGARFKINVALFENMTDLNTVYVIKSRDFKAIQVVDTLRFNE